MEVSGQFHAPAVLTAGERAPQYPLNRGLGGPLSRSVRLGEEKNLFLIPGFEPRTVQPVA
jgi:hypothetical protein